MADPPGGGDAHATFERLASTRFTEYVDLWERAAGKVTRAEYHSEDLIEDSYTWLGMWARDATAWAALTWSTTTPNRRGAARAQSRADVAGDTAGDER